MIWRIFASFSLVVTLPLLAQEDKAAATESEKSASPVMRDLTEDERAILAKQKVLISRHEVKQCFTAYMDKRYPRFVTSDAVLNAYHVLFEETLRQQEIFQSRHLSILCKDLWRLLTTIERMYLGDDAKIAAAKKRARFVIGVAAALMNEALPNCEPELHQAIQDEVKIIIKAEGRHKPLQLGAADPDFHAFDDTIFRPVGFYSHTPILQRYFRALRWLQVVPFRAHHEEELLAFHMIEICTQTPWRFDDSKDVRLLPVGLDMATWDRLSRVERHRLVFANAFGLSPSWKDLFEQVLSSGDELPVTVNAAFFEERLQMLKEQNSKSRIIRNDRIRETIADATRYEFRVLSDSKLPEDDALTFLSRVQGRSMNQRSPGLEFAAWLSVPMAEKKLGKELLDGLSPLRPRLETYGDAKLEALPWWQRINHSYWDMSLQYHTALRLLAEVDERAPAFMHGDAWRTKTLQSVAASWSQFRHAWSLQSKPEIHVSSASPADKGFVEPVPEFFRRLGTVAEIVGHASYEVEMNNDPVFYAVENLHGESQWLRDTASQNPSKSDITLAFWSGNRSLADYRGYGVDFDEEAATAADLNRLADDLDALAAELERDVRPGNSLWERVQEKCIHTPRLWHKLQILCLTLAAVADKQLQKTPLSADDSKFIEGVGYELSEIMLYRGQAMMFPCDDAPRITRIVSDTQTGQIMHVGIGRPRLMFVLYPWEGREVLCRGVVMPYHEVLNDHLVSDEEWLKRQSGTLREGIPGWLRGLVPSAGVILQDKE